MKVWKQISGERTRPECWFQRPAETNFGQRGGEFRPLIATVGEQLLKKGKHSEQGRHDENGSISILDVGRMDNSVKQQA